MTTLNVTYNGRGFDSIINYIDNNGNNGTITGHVVRVTGEKVAIVEFSIKNDNLFLMVDGVDFSNVTEAIRYLTVKSSKNDASGSNDDGNSANNVIGNYAIMRHIIFSGVSLEQIVGKANTMRARITKSPRTYVRSVGTARILNTTAREGFFKLYPDYAVIKGISKQFSLNTSRMSYLLDTLTTNEFQLMFGSSDNEFDLSIYKI